MFSENKPSAVYMMFMANSYWTCWNLNFITLNHTLQFCILFATECFLNPGIEFGFKSISIQFWMLLNSAIPEARSIRHLHKNLWLCVIMYEMCTESCMCSYSIWWFWSSRTAIRQSHVQLLISESVAPALQASTSANIQAPRLMRRWKCFMIFSCQEAEFSLNQFMVNYTGCVQNGANCTLYTAYISISFVCSVQW